MSRMKLSTLIAKEKWTKVIERIASSPNELFSWDNYRLPIHRACESANVPIEVVESIIEVHPQSVKDKTKISGRIPLHNAVLRDSSTMADVVEVLLRYYTGGASVRDSYGRTPLSSHLFYSPSPSLEVVEMLVEAYPDAVRICDKYEWYPLHCAAYCGDWEISQYLIELYPDALLETTTCGETPRDIANDNDEHQMGDILREEEDTRFKGKRLGIVPFLEKSGQDIRDDDIVNNPSFCNESVDNSIDDDIPVNDSVGVLSAETLPFENMSSSYKNSRDNDKAERTEGLTSVPGDYFYYLCPDIKQEPCNINVCINTPSTLTTIDKHEKDLSNNILQQKVQGENTLGNTNSCRVTPYMVGNRNEVGLSVATRTYMEETSMDTTVCSTTHQKCFMHHFRQKLEEVEAFWDVQPLSTQNAINRITALEQKVFNKARKGGLKVRLRALVYVDGIENGTWEEWVSGIELFVLNEQCRSCITKRIEMLEKIVEGNVKTGNLYDRIFALDIAD